MFLRFLSNLKALRFIKRLFFTFYKVFKFEFFFGFFSFLSLILELIFFTLLAFYLIILFFLYSIKIFNIGCLIFDNVLDYLVKNEDFIKFLYPFYDFLILYDKVAGLSMFYNYVYNHFGACYLEVGEGVFLVTDFQGVGYTSQIHILYHVICIIAIFGYFYVYFIESYNAIANPFAFHLRGL